MGNLFKVTIFDAMCHRRLDEILKTSHSRCNRSTLKTFDQFICSSLAVPLINSSHDFSHFEKFVKMITTSCLLTILTNQNARI